MKRTALISILFAAACGGGGSGDDTTPGPDANSADAATGPQTIRVTDDITSDTTWITGNTYVIPRLKQLFVEPGAELTIEPGVVVEGEQGAVLVITRGAKIHAIGTVDNPIMMTTAQPDGQKTKGYWGGLLVLGAATINTNVNSTPPSNEAVFEAFTSAIPEGYFGGDDDHDSSGEIEYVHIEFAGFNFVADREFNNLTLCGVGDGTTVDHVQVHGGKDDGIELFGGAVNVSYILSDQNEDDGFDTDNGWHGKAQFVIIEDVTPDASREDSDGFESDNHGTAASYTAEPRTLPTMYNFTVIGSRNYVPATAHLAMLLRRGTGGHYYNGIVTQFHDGIELRDQATKDQADAGDLFFKNMVIFNNGIDRDSDQVGDNWPDPQATGDIVESDYFTDPTWNNTFTDPGMQAAATLLDGPDFRPNTTITGGATPPDDGFFDATATFIGAMDATNDWTTGWTSYAQPGG